MDWHLLEARVPFARSEPRPPVAAAAARTAVRAPSAPTGTAATVRAALATARQGVERSTRPLRREGIAEYLRWRSRPFDLMHVHGAHKAGAARRIGRPLAVHLHGSDIRLMQYAPSTSRSVREGVRSADLVVFSTPDLLEHAQRVRSDVHYLPVPISSSELPSPPPDEERRGILFVSRWDASKGGERMLEIAELLQEHAPEIPVHGLDWGDGTGRARQAGVVLLPRQHHADFLRTVAARRVAIGQANPMIGTSELEALGLGLPLVGSFDPSWYRGLGKLSGDSAADQADAAIQAHRDAQAARAHQDGVGFVRREHETSTVLERLITLYREIDPALSRQWQ